MSRVMPNTCTIFILPPSIDSLRERLTQRAQDDKETIERRMRQAADEISHVGEADFVVVNEDFDRALDDLRAIVRSQGLRLASQQDLLAKLI